MNGGHEGDLRVLRQIAVLYVEDEEITRRDVESLLRPLAARVHTAGDGQEGLFEFVSQRPDVVITDICMPVLDGIGLVGKIREMDLDVPVIIATAADDPQAMARAINAGVGGYLLKPVDPEALVRILAAQGRIVLARKELVRQRDLNLVLRESIPFPVMLLDLAGQAIVTANAAARRLGFAEAQKIAGPMFPEPILTGLHNVASYFEKGRDEVLQDGQHAAFGRIFEFSHRPITADLVFFMAQDVTERKRLEQLREDVERITRHDLKSPLNIILNVPELLRDAFPQGSEEAQMLRLVRQAGSQMLHMINLSLDLYKMELGSYRLCAQAVDVAAVLCVAAAEQDPLVEGKRLCLDIKAAEDAGEPERRPLAAGDAFLLQSLFANLLRNAAEASPDEGIVSVAIIPGDTLEIRIHNFGAVPAEVRESFFEKYATAGKKDGTGLGTHSAWLIAKAHGGQIGFTSSDAEGTTVWVRLPAWR
jgi:signal transduction histidine kinase